MHPLPPMSSDGPTEGVGPQSVAPVCGEGDQTSPGGIFPSPRSVSVSLTVPEQTLAETEELFESDPLFPAGVITFDPEVVPVVDDLATSHALVAALALDAPEPEDDPQAVKWSGEPTRRMLRVLALEARCPSFDADAAVLVLNAVDSGMTLKAVCETPGYPPRSTVRAWAHLVPKFAEYLEKAQRGLGDWYRDCAAEEKDPAMMSAMLRLAGSYDSKIKTGDAGEGSGGITVQVVKFGGGP